MELLEKQVVQAGFCKNDRIELTPLDIMVGHANFGGVYFFRKAPDIEKMKAALSKALDFYPTLAGSMFSDQGRFFVVRNNAGVAFSVWQSQDQCPDFGCPEPLYEGTSLLDEDIGLEQLVSGAAPLAQFRITLFRDGGAALGVRNIHSVVDGSVINNFLLCWSLIYQGGTPAPVNAFPRENITRLGTGDGRAPSARFVGVPQPGPEVAQRLMEDEHKFGTALIEISNEVMDALVVECRRGVDRRLSSSDVVHALIWKALVLNLPAKIDHINKVFTICDIRNVKDLGIPSDYEGNALLERSARLPLSTLKSVSVKELALLFNEQIKPLASKDVRQDIAFLNREYEQGRLTEAGTFANAFLGAVTECLDGTGIFVNDMRLLKTMRLAFEGQTFWHESMITRRMPYVLVYPGHSATLFRCTVEKPVLEGLTRQLKTLATNGGYEDGFATAATRSVFRG